MKKFIAVMMTLGCMALSAKAFTFDVASIEERAAYGATHTALITWKDLTTTATNTSQTFTNISVQAKMGVKLVAAYLDQAFDTGNTNYTGSTLIKVGDGDDDDYYLSSTELNADGTEVFLKYGRSAEYSSTSVARTNATGAIILQAASFGTALNLFTTNITFLNVATQAQTVTVCTNVTLTTAPAVTNATLSVQTNTYLTAISAFVGTKVYTAADTVDIVITPNAEEALDACTNGQIRLYFRIDDAGSAIQLY